MTFFGISSLKKILLFFFLPQAPQWLQMPAAPEAAAMVPGQLALPSTEPEAKSMDEALIRALDKQARTEAAPPNM